MNLCSGRQSHPAAYWSLHIPMVLIRYAQNTSLKLAYSIYQSNKMSHVWSKPMYAGSEGSSDRSLLAYPLSTQISRTPDLDFRCFLPMWDHSISARGKDKKRTATCLPHAGRTSTRDVIIMLKLRHHVASQGIQDFLEVFFHVLFSNIKPGI